MNRENSNAHLVLLRAIAALAFCAAVVVFFHAAPYYQMPVATITAPSADCLPSGSGGPCIPFDQIQKMMRVEPDTSDPIPANPATADEEKI
jgi:hypothetical protein